MQDSGHFLLDRSDWIGQTSAEGLHVACDCNSIRARHAWFRVKARKHIRQAFAVAPDKHHVKQRLAAGQHLSWARNSPRACCRHVGSYFSFPCPCCATCETTDKNQVFAYRIKEDNPFALPSDEEIFMLQEVERQQRSQLMASMRSLPVHLKSTFSSQIQATVVREVGLEHTVRKAEPKKR